MARNNSYHWNNFVPSQSRVCSSAYDDNQRAWFCRHELCQNCAAISDDVKVCPKGHNKKHYYGGTVYQWRAKDWGGAPTHRVVPWSRDDGTSQAAKGNHHNNHPPNVGAQPDKGKGKGKGKGKQGKGKGYEAEMAALRKENVDLKQRNAPVAALAVEDVDNNGTQHNRKQEDAERAKQRTFL